MNQGPPEVLDDHLDRYVAQEGDTVKLLCPIVASPKPIVEWYQDDHLVTAAWERYRTNRKHLRIKPVTLSDSGLFVCKAVNGFGSLSVKIQLVVHARKDIEKLETQLFRTFGGGEMGSSSSMGSPMGPSSSDLHHIATGFHNSGQGEPVDHHHQSADFFDFMTGRRHGHVGGDGSHVESQADGHVEEVDGVAPMMLKHTQVHDAKVGILKASGETLQLECYVDGLPPPTIVWYKDGDILLTPNLQTDRSQTILMIPDLQVEDSGKYVCKARNVYGQVNATFPVKVYDELQTPQLLGPKEEVATVSLGQDESVTFDCAVRSVGPTQIQWLKQLHEHQQPKNKNKTVVVFDFVFEILQPSSQVQGPGGYHNISLQIGPPIVYEDAGRYVCLINNPQGHKHKEIFLKIADYNSHHRNPLYDPFNSNSDEHDIMSEKEIQKRWPSSSDLVMIIGIPFLSTGLVILLLAVVCVKRLQKSSTPASPIQLSPDASLQSTAKAYSSDQRIIYGKESSGSNEWSAANSGTVFANINNRATINQSIYSTPLVMNRASSLLDNNNSISTARGVAGHPTWSSPSSSLRLYDNPTANLVKTSPPPPAAGLSKPDNSHGYSEIIQPSECKGNTYDDNKDELTWVEVSNRECQTPSHWVYNNMTLEQQAKMPNILENPLDMRTTFSSPYQSGYLVDYSLPKDSTTSLSTAQSRLTALKSGGGSSVPASMQNSPIMGKNKRLNQIQQHLYQNIEVQQQSATPPPPPPYIPPLRHLPSFADLKSKSATSSPTAFANIRKFTSLEQSAGQPQKSLSFKKPLLEGSKAPQVDVSQPVARSPPSDHFYFKIYDGKTEFI